MNPLTLLPAFAFALMSFGLVLAAVWMWNRRPPLSQTAAMLMLACAGWVLAWALAWLSTDLAFKTTMLLVRFAAIASTPTLWLIIALQYSGYAAWLTRRRLIALALPLLGLWLLLLTNPSHELIYQQIRLDPADPWLTLNSQHGPGFWVFAAYAYAMLIAGNLIVARMLTHSYSLYRRQAVTLIVAALLPGFSGLLDIFLSSRLPLPLTPIAVAAACLTVSVMLVRLRRGDILSVARDTVIDGLSDGLVVLDNSDRVVSLNPAAQHLIEPRIDLPVGQTIQHTWPALAETLANPRLTVGSPIEMTLATSNGPRVFDVRLTNLLDKIGRTTSRIITVRDITERKRAEEQLKASLLEKEVLLKEIHHRVKNNLQVVYSLLNLQASQTTDEASREVLRDSQNRVRSMALVHETLYRSPDLARVDFADYASNLAAQLARSYRIDSAAIQLSVQAASDVRLSIDVAIPCGLIINELVSNALKHAFPNGRSGIVSVRLARALDEQIVITVADDGIGLPAGFDHTQTESLGMQLVIQLVQQIQGRLTSQCDGGTQFTIEFRAR